MHVQNDFTLWKTEQARNEERSPTDGKTGGDSVESQTL
jgi:hypothetical protein